LFRVGFSSLSGSSQTSSALRLGHLLGNSNVLEAVYPIVKNLGFGTATTRNHALGVTALLLLSGILLGCDEEVSSLMRVAYLSRTGTEIESLVGRWYDSEGSLVAVIHGGENARLGVRLWVTDLYGVEELGILKDELRFYVWTEDRWRFAVSLRRVGEDEAILAELPAGQPRRVGLGCCVCSHVGTTRLIRNPPASWFLKLSTRRAGQASQKVQDAFWTEVLRIL
jgi:hypothetical protein